MKVGNSPVEISVKSKRFLGVLRFVPNDFKAEDVAKLIPSCEKAEQISQSRTFRLYFPSKEALEANMKEPLKIGFECFRIDVFQTLPRRCFKCHHVGHLAAECHNAKFCSQCTGSDHKNIKE